MRGSMVILLVGLLIPTNYHRPPHQPSSGKSDGRPRIVGARSAPFDIANAPKRTLRAAARRQIVFKGGSNASCKADNDRERLRITSETFSNFKWGDVTTFTTPVGRRRGPKNIYEGGPSKMRIAPAESASFENEVVARASCRPFCFF